MERRGETELLERTSFSALRASSPIPGARIRLSSARTGLLIVDEVVGFCTVGAGALAPVAPNAQVDRMVAETDALARRIGHKMALRDSHPVGKVERPYPPHCERGTGHDLLVPPLAWLEDDADTLVLPKDCIDAVVGTMVVREGRIVGNAMFDWIASTGVERLVVVGICTDICVLTAVTSLLSARTRGMLAKVDDVVVYEPACSTYDLPLGTARELGLPDTAAHPQALYHLMGLLAMQNQGALIADGIDD